MVEQVAQVYGQGFNVRLQHCIGVEYTQNCLWVADTYNHKIKLVNPHTGDCHAVLGDGSIGLKDGQGKMTRFFEPSGLTPFPLEEYLFE